jgi:hypothetical protein
MEEEEPQPVKALAIKPRINTAGRLFRSIKVTAQENAGKGLAETGGKQLKNGKKLDWRGSGAS